MKGLWSLVLISLMSLIFTMVGNAAKEPVQRQIGLIKHDPSKTFNGYTLFAPKHYKSTYLIDMEGHVYNQWESNYEPGQAVYLLENGNLLHCCFTTSGIFIGGGEGGHLEEFNWNGDLVWEWTWSDNEHFSHHDVEQLPNGNLLVMAVEYKTLEQALAAGFSEKGVRKKIVYPEYILEISRFGSRGYEIVWEWHIWDHLIQDLDPTKENYGVVKDHPELLNCGVKYVPPFWNHGNSLAYNPELDQIILSARGQNEFWVIDHSTTTREAAGHSGGKYGQGGDILYRWGCSSQYEAGEFRAVRRLFNQHDAQWVPPGYPGAGNITVFNNGSGGQGYSEALELVPPVDKNGFYEKIKPGEAYGPKEPLWIYYNEENPEAFYSSDLGGASRLPNGNTLICNGVDGQFLEVTQNHEVVWEYVNPITDKPLKQGDPIPRDARSHPLNAVFKIHRYAPAFPAFKGKDMKPIKDSLIAK